MCSDRARSRDSIRRTNSRPPACLRNFRDYLSFVKNRTFRRCQCRSPRQALCPSHLPETEPYPSLTGCPCFRAFGTDFPSACPRPSVCRFHHCCCRRDCSCSECRRRFRCRSGFAFQALFPPALRRRRYRAPRVLREPRGLLRDVLVNAFGIQRDRLLEEYVLALVKALQFKNTYRKFFRRT